VYKFEGQLVLFVIITLGENNGLQDFKRLQETSTAETSTAETSTAETSNFREIVKRLQKTSRNFKRFQKTSEDFIGLQ
jgi:hypothetical protein